MSDTVEWTERIECPECGHVFDAIVERQANAPWPTYMAECPNCEYWIMESEWNPV